MKERALVLGGAGATGNAWEIGVIAGLQESGVDVTRADVIVGTSAGSTVAAQITSGTTPSELLANILAPRPRPLARTGGTTPERAPIGAASDHMERTNEVIDASSDAADMRRKMGTAALETDPESHESAQREWRATVASRLTRQEWPQQLVLIPAVDAHSGEARVFDRSSGVELVDAVAASTSNGFGVPPYRIGDNRYINGGYRRNENADLAEGFARVIVLSPFGGRSRQPLEWGMDLAAQVRELQESGSRVETIFPDSDSEYMFGANATDLSLRLSAAQAGYDQGKKLAERLSEFWR